MHTTLYTNQPTQVTQNRQGVSNSRDPVEPPTVFAYELDFVSFPTQLIDLTVPAQQGAISGIQTIYVDNSLNDKAVVITVTGTNQRLPIGAAQAGYFPILATSGSLKFNLDGTGSSTGTAVYMAFLNVPVPAQMWYPYDAHTHG